MTRTRELPHFVVALGLALACACSSPVRAIKGRVLVAAIEIEGNDSIDDDDLVDGLALARLMADRQDFDPYLVAVDAERLRGAYLRRGFFRVLIGSDVREVGGLVTVRFRVVEGPRATLARVEFSGLPDDPRIDRQRLRGVIPMEDGDPFVYEAFDQAKPKLVGAIEAFGYPHASLDATLAADRLRDEAIIHLRYTPGPLAAFGEIRLVGVEGPLRDAALARFMVKQGDRYSSTKLGDTQDALYDMGRFSAVKVEPDRSAGGPVVPVKISVTEAPPRELRIGAGAGIDPVSYEVRGLGALRVAGWPFALTTSAVEFRPAIVKLRDEGRDDDAYQPRIEALASIKRMDLFRTFMTGEAEVGYQYRAFEAYTSYGPGVRLGLRTPIYRRIVEVAAGWQLKGVSFNRIDEAISPELGREIGLSLDQHDRIGFYEQAVFFDLRDDPFSPRLGAYAEVRLEEGTPAAGGEFRYFKVAPELRGFVPLGPVVLAARGRLGTIAGDLPVTQRYFAGGASSQRGFPERRLAPTATDTVIEDGDEVTHAAVYGGGALVEAGPELRFPLGTLFGLDVGGVTFLDGADVTERWADMDVGHLHWAAGAGVRVATPIGPFRFDLGYRLNRIADLRPDDRFNFHLSVGEAF